MYFIPESKADGDVFINGENKDYREWQRLGYVTILPGNEVDSEAVVRWYWDMFQMYNVKPFKIGYDNWNAKGMVQSLERYFGEDIAIRVRMDFNSLSNPMRVLGADLKDKKVNYDNNGLSKWCLKNVAIKTNNLGQIMPVKVQGNSSNRIDGALSKIICYNVKSIYLTDFTFVSNSNRINVEAGD
jgi:phage terminase large subunit-like protein